MTSEVTKTQDKLFDSLKEEAFGVCQTEFVDSFSKEVWSTTYKNHADESVSDTFFRVAYAVASVEDTPERVREWTLKYYDLLSSFKATSGGRIYSNAGTEWSGTTLMNCFVSPRSREDDIDSLKGIITNLDRQTQTLKSEGGWGENFSYIRPRGAFINGIGVETPGSVKYMEGFDKFSEIITSGSGKESKNKKAKGKIRKGAMMGVLDIWHPDIVEFIKAKQTPGRLSKFNLSVNCTDAFMTKVMELETLRAAAAELKSTIDAVETKEVPAELYNRSVELAERIQEVDKWDLIFPDTAAPEFKTKWYGDMHEWLAAGLPVIEYHTDSPVTVSYLWNLIMESTYNRAEPGVLFLDRANYYNPLNYEETIFATNPCGEQTLAPAGVCCLGSLNLTQFINESGTGFDLVAIKKYTRYLVRFLDNINTLSNAPLPEYEYSMKHKRRIGMGVLGWASALLMLKVRFASDRASELRDEVMGTLATEAYKASIELAEEKGKFTLCDPEKHAAGPFIQNLNLPEEYMDRLRKTGIRNSSLLSIQPTGNTSIFANVVSGGLEPIFSHEYIRTVIVNTMPSHIEAVCPKWYEGGWEETSMFSFAKEGDEEILRGVDDFGTVYKIDRNRGLTKEVACMDYGVRWLKDRNEWEPDADWAAGAFSLNVNDHVVDMKGFARWVDSAMSKTVNVPNEYPYEDFKAIYTDTYASGFVKGVTTYRSGTMTSVLSVKDEKEATDADEEIILDDVKLPAEAPASMKTIRAEGKKWYLTVVHHEDSKRPFALFVKTNHHEKNVVADEAVEKLVELARKKGIPERHIDVMVEKTTTENNSSKVARVLSFVLRHGVLIKNIVAVLDNVESAFAGSFVFHIKKFLATYVKDGEQVEDETCLECGSANVVYREGCKLCVGCGSSKCG